jgi:hypothetical protein
VERHGDGDREPDLRVVEAERNVAIPSGKLWIAMATATAVPVLRSFAAAGSAIASPREASSSAVLTSWGFSSPGTSWSIARIRRMPRKNEPTESHAPAARRRPR